jgi:hypothetical protein
MSGSMPSEPPVVVVHSSTCVGIAIQTQQVIDCIITTYPKCTIVDKGRWQRSDSSNCGHDTWRRRRGGHPMRPTQHASIRPSPTNTQEETLTWTPWLDDVLVGCICCIDPDTDFVVQVHHRHCPYYGLNSPSLESPVKTREGGREWKLKVCGLGGGGGGALRAAVESLNHV